MVQEVEGRRLANPEGTVRPLDNGNPRHKRRLADDAQHLARPTSAHGMVIGEGIGCSHDGFSLQVNVAHAGESPDAGGGEITCPAHERAV
jgi:hypothetical protein